MNPTTTLDPALAATGEGVPGAGSAAGSGAHSPQTRLQDLLPDINALAQRAGGLKRLGELIATLQTSKEP